jgi:hypothetical protein
MIDQIKQKVVQYRWFMAALLACCFCFGGGWYAHKPDSIVKTEVQTVEKIVQKDTQHADKTTTQVVVKKPDGTTETTTIHNDITDVDKTKSDTATKDSTKDSVQATAYMPKYSVGVMAQVGMDNLLNPSYDASIGYRILGNLWGEALWNTGHHEGGVGVRIEF